MSAHIDMAAGPCRKFRTSFISGLGRRPSGRDQTYVLRFWETEFPSLGPKKSGTGTGYRRKDVELVFEIKRLLYEKRFTIEARASFSTPAASPSQGVHGKSKRKKTQGDLFGVDRLPSSKSSQRAARHRRHAEVGAFGLAATPFRVKTPAVADRIRSA
jgi:hypothetical protein